MENTNCRHMEDLFAVEVPAWKKAIERNRYYLGRISKDYISEEKAREDFSNNHLHKYWGMIFKALYCRFKCLDRDSCETGKRKYHALAGRFKEEVERFGIDRILAGEDETEEVFKKYREYVEGEGA